MKIGDRYSEGKDVFVVTSIFGEFVYGVYESKDEIGYIHNENGFKSLEPITGKELEEYKIKFFEIYQRESGRIFVPEFQP